MKNRFALLASLVLVTPFAAQATAKVPAEFAALVPADAVVFVQFRSVDELLGFVGRFAPLEYEEFAAQFGIPGDVALVDRKGALGFALELSAQSMQPTPIFLVTTADATAFAESLGVAPEQVKSSGSVVAVAMQGALGAPGDGAFLNGLEDGLVTARVDLEQILQMFGPMATMMISMTETQMQQQMKEEMAQQGAGSPPIDPTEVMGMYFDFARDFIESAARLELVLDVHGSEAELRGGLWNKDGSPLAAWGKSEDVDYEALARRIDAEGAVQAVQAFDFSGMLDKLMPVYESMISAASDQGDVPPEVSEAFHAYLEAIRELAPLMSTCAMSIDFAGDGLRGSIAYDSIEPETVVKGWLGLLDNPALSALGVHTTAPESVERGIAKVTNFRTKIDAQKLVTAFGGPDQPEVLGQMEAVFAAVLGTDGLNVEVGTSNGAVLSVIGGDDGYRKGAWERLIAAKSSVPPALSSSLEHIRGCNPAMAIHYDFGRLFDGISTVVEKLDQLDPEAGEELGVLANLDFALSAWFGVDGSRWKGGLRIDLDEMQSLVQTLAESAGGEDVQGY
jgi:hypothetical protein